MKAWVWTLVGWIGIVGGTGGLAASGRAEDLSLEGALNEAMTSSPQLQKTHSQTEERRWKKMESYSGFLPTVTGTATHLVEKKYALTDVTLPGSPATISIPNIIPSSDFSLLGQWSIFDGFASTNRLLAARRMSDAAELDEDWAHFSLKHQVILEFSKALAAQTLKQVAEQNLKTLEDHLRDVKLFKQSGISTNYDVLRVEVQVSEARTELLNAGDNEVVAKDRLGEVLGKPSEERELKGTLPQPNAQWVTALKTGPVATLENKDRKDLRALELQSEAYRKLSLAAQSHWMPKVSFYGEYDFYNNRSDSLHDWDAYRNAYQLGISLSWNLFDGFASFAKSREVAEQRVQSEKTLRIAELKGSHDYEMWRRKFLYFCSVYTSRLSDVEKSTETVRIAKEGRRAGTRTSTDLLDAELELFRARAGVVNAQLGGVEALTNLELTTGQDLSEGLGKI